MPDKAVPKGDCYEVALHLVLEDDTLTLVHGWPIGQAGGTATPGERFGHAWVERTDTIVFPAFDGQPAREWKSVTFIDKSNGKDTEMLAQMAYKIGGMDEEHIARYTRDEAVKMMLEFKHYGPWDDDHPPLADFVDDDDDYYECLACGERFGDDDDHECPEEPA